MLYAQVLIGLPVEGPFDYIVPEVLNNRIGKGQRVWVDFRNKKTLGYVVGLSNKTAIANLKQILELIDDYPILNENMLLLTQKLSQYYCCSWGEAIECALPDALRRGKKISLQETAEPKKQRSKPEVTLIHDLSKNNKWEVYIECLKQARKLNLASIVICPDINSALAAKSFIGSKLSFSLELLYRKKPKELEEWLNIKLGNRQIVIGTRSTIFAPLNNLGLVIIDEEQDFAYKQDQVPHYHVREVALMRINIDKAKLVLGSSSPSLESYHKATRQKIKYILIPSQRVPPEVKIVDLKTEGKGFGKSSVLSKYLIDSVYSSLNLKEKILIFLDRKGFATYASCKSCNTPLKCPRCNINLVYYFKENLLSCHYCNFKMPTPSLCPNCNAGYIKFSGLGTEKLESELSRLFPAAKIKRIDKRNLIDKTCADIFLSTRSVIKMTDFNFDLSAAISLDNSLNRIDFRSAERTFSLLIGLQKITEKKFFIQTRFPGHYCFQALLKGDIASFYKQELEQRRQLGFPPYRHFIIIKLRGTKLEQVKKTALVVFHKLKKYKKNKSFKIISANPSQPPKLRGNFYWQILLSTNNIEKANRFLKIHLKNLPHSGIIVTVDVDPL